MPSMHTSRVIKTNGGTAVGQGVAKNFQSNNAVNIKRVSGSSDGAGTRFFDNLPNNTNLGSVKSQISSPSTYNPITTPYVAKGFATNGGGSVTGFGAVNSGFAVTQFRKNPGDSALVSAKPLAGIAGLAKFGGTKTYSLVKTYALGELDKTTAATKWIDLYGRVLEVNGSNIRLLNSRDSNAEITANTVQATDGATNDDIAPGLRSYSNNKGLTYYTKLSASANPKVMIIAESASLTRNING
jgi:hypothetical protein